MEHIVFQGPTFHWLDVVNPTREELERIASQYGLHPTSVQDCLDPEHFPKYECIGPIQFVILRAYDEKCDREADTVQELTRKIAVFISDRFLLTVHRVDQPFMVRLREAWQGVPKQPPSAHPIVARLLAEALATYNRPIDQALDQLERLEMGLFGAKGSEPFDMEECYYLKRKSFVFRRLLHSFQDLQPKLMADASTTELPIFQSLKEDAQALYYYADELVESVNSLLNLHISLASQRTNEASHHINEVIRVLTIFSVFMLPLNLLTGFYGMNFEYLPGLRSHHGLLGVLVAMCLVTLTVYFWFRRKGWIR